nr:MAG TPA: hypothetical protein [Caudoviricetes sp.]
MVSILVGVCCCGMAVVCAVASLRCPACTAWPHSTSSVHVSTASCRVLFVAGCVVCGCVFLYGVRVVGYPSCAPPSQWWWVGL